MLRFLRYLTLLFLGFSYAVVPVFSIVHALEIEVTEKIPGAECGTGSISWSETPDKKRYKCTVNGGLATVQGFLGGLIKYATFITALLGILMIVASGVQYAMSEDGEHTKIKERIVKLISGLILLFLTGFILNSIAPWIYGS